MKIINTFELNEKEYFKDLAKEDNISDIDNFINSLDIEFNNLKVIYYKDQQGILYKKTLFNGKKINDHNLNGYYKGFIHDFETKTGVLFS